MAHMGKRLQELRTRKRLSQDELASTLGLNGQTICNWEQRKVLPNRSLTWRKLAEFYGFRDAEALRVYLLGEPEPLRLTPRTAELLSDLAQRAGQEPSVWLENLLDAMAKSFGFKDDKRE